MDDPLGPNRQSSPYYTLAEAADRMRVSPDRLKQAIQSGDLRAKRSGKDKKGNPAGLYLFSAAALDEWFDGLPDA